MSFFKLLKSRSAFSVVEVMVATALISIAGVGVMNIAQIANQDSLQLKAIRSIVNARGQIEAALRNPASFRQTYAQNLNFSCVNTAPGCNLNSSNNGYYDFIIYGVATGEKVSFDATDLTTRVSIDGGPCAIGVPNPSAKCPIKYIARWKPLCSSYPCENPTLDIQVSLQLEFGTNAPPLNPQKYAYDTVRGINDGSIESACLILNGTYNSLTGTCYPKNAGKTCAASGKPAQIVSSVDVDGNITCTRLYSVQCNQTTQVMTGISANGQAQCAPKTQPPSCPVDCVGAWGSCSKACGGGVQTYAAITPASNGGAACTSPAIGATQTCNTNPCAQNCVGSWGACSQPCGGGQKIFAITTPAANGGAACTANNGDTMTCNSQACAPNPVNCSGNWSSCDPITGTQTFSVVNSPQNGGTACPASPRACTVNCVGGWGACAGGPPQFKTYTWTTTPKNGGTNCTYTNGQTDATSCVGPIDCDGTWSACNSSTGTQNFSMTQPTQNGGAACPASPKACAVNCVGNWSNCSGSPPSKTYTWITPPLNGGVTCPFPNGQTDNSACPVPVNCVGSWSSCSGVPMVKTFSITTPASNGGSVCAYSNGQTDATGCPGPVNCVGNWTGCTGSPAAKIYVWTTAPANGGAACPYTNGQTDSSGCAVPVNCAGSWGSCVGYPAERTFTITTAAANGGAACSYSNGQTDSAGCPHYWSLVRTAQMNRQDSNHQYAENHFLLWLENLGKVFSPRAYACSMDSTCEAFKNEHAAGEVCAPAGLVEQCRDFQCPAGNQYTATCM